MTKVIMSPVTRKAVYRTLTGFAKLGAFAAVTIMASKTFKAAGDEFVAETIQHYRAIKNIA